MRMVDEVDFLSIGCFEYFVNEVGYESCCGVDVVVGFSGFYKWMCFWVVVECVGVEFCCFEVGIVV